MGSTYSTKPSWLMATRIFLELSSVGSTSPFGDGTIPVLSAAGPLAFPKHSGHWGRLLYASES